jgi:tRNA (guanine-N7-)-methyltransferase
LKPRQAALMASLLPHLAIDLGAEIDVGELFGQALGWPAPRPGASLDGSGPAGLHALPGPALALGDGAVVLEIGFGAGEHLVAQAAAHPKAGFIGVEPFLNGVASCLTRIEASGATNIRLHQGDARELLARLPAAALDLCYILFPDPWPKTRHHKRRLIQPDFLTALARATKPGAEVRFATDWADYAAWTLERFTRGPGFAWMGERAADWRHPWPGHVPTRYQQKRLGDCAPVWLRFRRVCP